MRGTACFTLAALTLVGVSAPAAAKGAWIRIGLVERGSDVLVSASVAGEVVDDRGRALMRIGALESWTVSADGNGVRFNGPEGKSAVFAGGLRLQPADAKGTPLVFARTRWYRGTLEFVPGGGGLTVVNHLPLEHYLYGVVPSEMPRSWPMESLKSQAVAARSYALANKGKHKSRGFDLCSTDECQVYGGAANEGATTNQAIDLTRDQVVTFAGKVIPAYFHSSSGGYTENSEDVWMQKLPYIRAVPDFDQKSPHYTWYKQVGTGELANGLARAGVKIGQVLQVNPLSRSYSGRVKDVQVVGTEGSKVMNGESFRIAAGLNSTLFNVAPVAGAQPPTDFIFAGRGWGHGLGLSQWGAKTLAETGYSYRQILSHYYPGAQLTTY